jgi:hypothetical protein
MANGGRDPKDDRALLSFFGTPQQGADFIEFLEAQKAAGEHRTLDPYTVAPPRVTGRHLQRVGAKSHPASDIALEKG